MSADSQFSPVRILSDFYAESVNVRWAYTISKLNETLPCNSVSTKKLKAFFKLIRNLQYVALS